MEFNMTLTAEDRFEASKQLRVSTLKNHKDLRVLSITIRILPIFLFVVPFIGLIIIGEKATEFIIICPLAGAFLCFLISSLSTSLNERYRKKNEIIVTQMFRYIIGAEKIRAETEYTTEEVRIDSLTLYLENEKRCLLGGPNSLFSFPKSEIEKLPNKDEFYNWIDSMKKSILSTSS